jgi:hypothetical protein
MTEEPTHLLAEMIRLAHALPSDPGDYAEFSPRKRRNIRSELEKIVVRLNNIAGSLDSVRQPKHVFDPTSPKVIGELVASTLLLQDRSPLSVIVTEAFYGAGVYALYYSGPFDAYSPIAGKDHPIYVGKADPDELHALTAEQQGTRLYSRLKDHYRSVSFAQNLELKDFACRYLVVRSAWVETAESLLIGWFKPVWNNEMNVCYGFGKHGDSAKTRANERSPWDTLHPGRPWATAKNNTPNKKDVVRIRSDIAQHFANFPPNK